MSEPSKVIHVRNVGPEISENDLLQLVQPFGGVTKLVMLRTKNQALIQMHDVNSAISALQYYTNVQPSVRGRNVYIQFSSHQELTTVDNSQGHKGDQDSQPNRILLVTIHQLLYPITVEVLHQVFSPHGFVEKIVTFQKSAGSQALVQYQTRQSAVQARNALQGRNIYDGCCQLDIQFSNLTELQVNYNNERSRDFTNPSLPSDQKGSVLQPGYDGGLYALQPGPGPVAFPQIGSAAAIAAAFGGGLPPGISGTNDRCTVLVSNLNSDKVDEDKLFNLFSLYGNIVRIKILRNKPDHALIQMSDGLQAELAVHFLKHGLKTPQVGLPEDSTLRRACGLYSWRSTPLNSQELLTTGESITSEAVTPESRIEPELQGMANSQGAVLFDKRLEVNFSKHQNITSAPDTHEYVNSNLNRFQRNSAKNYRYCCAPTKTIHLSSLPQEITEEDIISHLEQHGPIVNSKVFEVNGKKQALVQFETEEQATEALVCKHASTVDRSIIKISFSQLQNI